MPKSKSKTLPDFKSLNELVDFFDRKNKIPVPLPSTTYFLATD